MGTKVVILVSGKKYLNQFGRAVECKKGEILVTTAKYGADLVDNDLASFDLPASAIAPASEQAAPAGARPFTDVDGVTDNIAASLMATGATWATINEISAKSLQKVPGIGPKLAERLKAQAALEVSR